MNLFSSGSGGPLADRAGLETRATVLRALRDELHRGGFLEVQTPARLPAPALEPHIDAEPCGDAYLRTSPELHMKRLLAAGHEKIYQIGPCFRRGEVGRLHHPEYTMLEWYRAGADYIGILEDARGLLRAAATACGVSRVRMGDAEADLTEPWRVLGVSEAYRKWAGWDPAAAWDADRFDLDWADCVEPRLRLLGVPVALTDYPAAAAALARLKPGDPTRAERWELVICGVELANAYSELTDAGEQRRRFSDCARDRAARGRPVYPMDEAFLAALDAGMPAAGGCALGIDRLAMLLAGGDSLDSVLAFRA
ncbi:MAG: amino acid--tRNA ligase-related protein [Kiritimatiellia bacterium]|nr:amino acid--tRNA ligase-related protein [Kiritimatiellia bacterium]